MRRACCLILPLLFASPATAARANRVVLITTFHGQFYLEGAFVPPPYEVSASFRLVGADTVWDGIYVNDVPVWRSPEQKQEPRDSLWSARWTAVREAVRRANLPLGPLSIEGTRRLAEVYASLDTMIDSARAVAAAHLLLYWHGETGALYPLDMTMEVYPPPPTPAQASRNFLKGTMFEYGHLAGGFVVMQHQGLRMFHPSLVRQFQRELEMLRRGDPGPYDILRDAELQEELLHPVPLPAPER